MVTYPSWRWERIKLTWRSRLAGFAAARWALISSALRSSIIPSVIRLRERFKFPWAWCARASEHKLRSSSPGTS